MIRLKGRCPYCGTSRNISENRLKINREIICIECNEKAYPGEYVRKKEKRKKKFVPARNGNINPSTPTFS